MPKVGRPSRPFYRKDRDAWVTRINGQQVTLAKGKANKRAAVEEFHSLRSWPKRQRAVDQGYEYVRKEILALEESMALNP